MLRIFLGYTRLRSVLKGAALHVKYGYIVTVIMCKTPFAKLQKWQGRRFNSWEPIGVFLATVPDEVLKYIYGYISFEHSISISNPLYDCQ